MQKIEDIYSKDLLAATIAWQHGRAKKWVIGLYEGIVSKGDRVPYNLLRSHVDKSNLNFKPVNRSTDRVLVMSTGADGTTRWYAPAVSESFYLVLDTFAECPKDVYEQPLDKAMALVKKIEQELPDGIWKHSDGALYLHQTWCDPRTGSSFKSIDRWV